MKRSLKNAALTTEDLLIGKKKLAVTQGQPVQSSVHAASVAHCYRACIRPPLFEHVYAKCTDHT